ncbi:MAG: site-2 protease family protein, partial [Armatimonadetes bacterium]|nr:site-2 protease family protein [Armatimonadota bacterium]
LMASVGHGVERGWSVVHEALKGLGLLAQGRKLDQVGGPVAILKLLSQAAGSGGYDLFETAAMLSIILGVMNLLPLPALDGGRLVFIFLEWGFRRPVIGRTREAYVHVVGLVVLLGLLALITVRDLRRW